MTDPLVMAALERLSRQMDELTAAVRGGAAVGSPYLTHTEAARYLRVTKRTLSNHSKEIKPVRGSPKNRPLYTREALDRWRETRPKGKMAGSRRRDA